MNNTQLLIDAAKAAGYLTETWYGNTPYIEGMLSRWNPIESNADAFRLLVRIKRLSTRNPSAWDEKPHNLQLAWSELIAAFESGDEARCRVAITTLAAEMHRAAQSQENAE